MFIVIVSEIFGNECFFLKLYVFDDIDNYIYNKLVFNIFMVGVIR